MADPVNYCSWVAESFCITQSEWATWTQAGLTVLTFVVALVRQERTDRRAAKLKIQSDAALLLERAEHAEQQRKSAAALLAEADINRRLRARATAISIAHDLLALNSAIDVLAEGNVADSPQQAFAEAAPHLELRTRAMAALDLMEATEAALKAVDGAQSLYRYLLACQDQEAFTPDDLTYLQSTAESLRPDSEAAEKAIMRIARGHVAAQA
ncbi:hypothetical protein ACODUO_03070 [Stenotrophomonas maltophilia]